MVTVKYVSGIMFTEAACIELYAGTVTVKYVSGITSTEAALLVANPKDTYGTEETT